MSLYTIQQIVLTFLDNLTYQRCRDCNEIVFDGYCDYCARYFYYSSPTNNKKLRSVDLNKFCYTIING